MIRMLSRQVVGKFLLKFLLITLLWAIPIGLLMILIFSVYPNYILRGHYSKTFIQTRHLAGLIVRKISPQKIDYNMSILLNGTNVALKEDSGLPPKVFQPLLAASQPNELPEAAYFKKPTKPVVWHPVMIPDPFTTYAPLPGKIAGLLFHNKQQFRYPTDLGKKKSNEIRIFITGGSVAWGNSATDIESTIAGFLEKGLRKKYPGLDIKVITAAAGGWTSTQERIWIFNRITEYEPDLIISYSGFNDFFETYLRKYDLFDNYVVEGRYFREAIKGYDYYNRGAAISMLGYNDTGSRFDSSDFPRKTLKNSKIINSYLKSISIPYIYVLQPVNKYKIKKQTKEGTDILDNYKYLGREMANQAKLEGYQFFDHSTLLDTMPELFLDTAHVGDRGNQIIANDLLDRLNLRYYPKKRRE